MIKSMCTRSVGAVLAMVLGAGLTGCPSPAPPPNLPPPEYEAPRDLDVPRPPPQDEDWPPAAAEPAPLPEPSPDVPIVPADEDAGADEAGIDSASETPDDQ